MVSRSELAPSSRRSCPQALGAQSTPPTSSPSTATPTDPSRPPPPSANSDDARAAAAAAGEKPEPAAAVVTSEAPPPKSASLLLSSLPTQVHGVVSTRPGLIFVIRRRDIRHVPPALTVETYRRRFVLPLCPTYSHTLQCVHGSDCDTAHAPIRETTRKYTPHVHRSRVDPASESFAATGIQLDDFPEPLRYGVAVTTASTSNSSPSSTTAEAAAGGAPSHSAACTVRTSDSRIETLLYPHECYVTRAVLFSNSGGGGGGDTDDGRRSKEPDADTEKGTTTAAKTSTAVATMATATRDGGVASHAPRRPLSHCAHWLVLGMCHFGADCRFVHMADPPSQLIEHASQTIPAGLQHQQQQQQRASDDGSSISKTVAMRRQEDPPLVNVEDHTSSNEVESALNSNVASYGSTSSLASGDEAVTKTQRMSLSSTGIPQTPAAAAPGSTPSSSSPSGPVPAAAARTDSPTHGSLWPDAGPAVNPPPPYPAAATTANNTARRGRGASAPPGAGRGRVPTAAATARVITPVGLGASVTPYSAGSLPPAAAGVRGGGGGGGRNFPYRHRPYDGTPASPTPSSHTGTTESGDRATPAGGATPTS